MESKPITNLGKKKVTHFFNHHSLDFIKDKIFKEFGVQLEDFGYIYQSRMDKIIQSNQHILDNKTEVTQLLINNKYLYTHEANFWDSRTTFALYIITDNALNFNLADKILIASQSLFHIGIIDLGSREKELEN